MTTIESYYLAMCVAALSAFAIALAYNAWIWKDWKSSRGASAPVEEREIPKTPQTKLAA